MAADPRITLTHRLEYAAASVVLGLLRVLPLPWASATGSALLRLIGPRLRVHRVAMRNLRRAFPDRDDAWIAATLRGMWDNLGRTLGEFPHTDAIVGSPRLEVVGSEHVAAVLAGGRPAVFFSGHLGNWELFARASRRIGLTINLIYRAPSNPLMAAWYASLRQGGQGELLPKGSQGARRAMALLASGGHIGMLVDQKMNDGLAVPFFGRDAMTAPALVQFALRYGSPVLPARIVRLPGCRFRMEILPPLALPPPTGERIRDLTAGMAVVNALLEDWIREHPEQWLWVHRRWPD